MRPGRVLACGLLPAVLWSAAVTSALAADAPEWLASSRKRPVPPFAAKAAAVVLMEEQMVTVSRTETRTRMREAVKILTTQGQSGASLIAPQRIGEDFKMVGGWKIRPDGDVVRYDRKVIVQQDADASYEFSLTRINTFWPAEARVGDIIAWEYETGSKPESYTQYWTFGSRLPVLLSRYGIKLPPDWKLRTLMRNHEEMAPAVDDEGYRVWEMRDLKGVPQEPLAPSFLEVAPNLMIAYGPVTGGTERTFDSWQSVARWYSGIAGRQIVADEEIRSTAARLASGAASPLDAVRSVTSFTQGVRYLNVAPGRSVAEPHPAPQILRNRFGDCEDKSVLTIALLKEIGVEAFPLLARTSRIGPLEPEFPAPNMFNHVVVAIKAPADVSVPSMIEAGPLGRLIVFDPTDWVTGLGDLDSGLQGTHAVISHGQHGALVTLPVLPPGASSRESELKVAFAPQGGLEIGGTLSYLGQYAAGRRAYYEAVRGDKRKEEFAARISSHYGRSEVRKLDVEGLESPAEPLVTRLDLSMPLPGRDLGSLRLLPVFFLLSTRAEPLTETERTMPLKIEAGFRELDRSILEVPAGWRVVEPLPEARASSDVGVYELTCRIDGGRLLIERSLEVKAAVIPVAGYPAVRKFFDDVAKHDALAVALEKTGG